jgi:hypothetical protein
MLKFHLQREIEVIVSPTRSVRPAREIIYPEQCDYDQRSVAPPHEQLDRACRKLNIEDSWKEMFLKFEERRAEFRENIIEMLRVVEEAEAVRLLIAEER